MSDWLFAMFAILAIEYILLGGFLVSVFVWLSSTVYFQMFAIVTLESILLGQCLPSNQVSPQGILYCLLPSSCCPCLLGTRIWTPASSKQVWTDKKFTKHVYCDQGTYILFNMEIVSNWTYQFGYEPWTAHEYFALCSEYIGILTKNPFVTFARIVCGLKR